MLTERTIEKSNRVRQALSRLATMNAVGENIRLSLPVAYPSGTCAAVEIDINGSECFITDCGIGYVESEFSAVQSYYDHAAKLSSKHFGVAYDGFNVFATWASVDRLESAIVAVANASVQAVTHAVMRAATDKERRSNLELFEKVTEVFGKHSVARTADIKGHEAQWEVHNFVSLGGTTAVFEFVSSHQNSIANKFQMFSDLWRVPDRPSLNAVVRSLKEIGSKGQMLADLSNVFELTAANDDYLRYARRVA